MPNIKSAVKRMRQNQIIRIRNRSRRAQMRTEIKKFRSLVDQGQIDEARTLLPSVFSVIDKTVQKGVVHANTAARYKSRLTKQLR